jgi:ATP-dependent DNA helicase RecG
LKKQVLKALQLDENHERECKLAQGGLPESIWETYSAFANTEGGSILLGIKEHRDSFTIQGLSEKQIIKYQKNFWSVLNDRNKISRNILLNHHVKVVEYDGKKLLEIQIPAADRHDKPVYVGTDPMKGTYRRDYEGDFLCTEASVRAMFADQRDKSIDSEVLEDMELDALNMETVKGYRVLFEQLHEGHPWNKLMKDEFLIKLKAAAKNKKGEVSPTVAGILMFGDADRITDVFPDYFLDYREECDEKGVRWLYRTHSNEGDWSGNLFDFFYKVTTRIDDDVAVPFVNRREGIRVDRVEVHDALNEAVANALVHSNYYGRRGIVIIKHGKEITISNPGTIRITKEEFYAGGNSDPRNPNLLKMFGFVNVGERAGSGVDKIMTAWEEQQYDISLRTERVTLKLQVGQIVYIPGAADLRKDMVNESMYEYDAKDLTDKELIIMDYIKAHTEISMGKATDICGYKTKSATRKIIGKLLDKGYIKKVGSGPKTRYRL